MTGSTFRSMLEEARRRRRAVGAFTCYDLAGLEAVAEAAAGRDAPAIVLVSPASFAGTGGARLGRAFAAAAAAAPTALSVQLDHCTDPAAIERAAEIGLGGVLADGSRLPFAENLAFTRAARAAIGAMGLEAELGNVSGEEDRLGATAGGAMTDPEQAERFAAACEADCLAVSVGNVHGRYEGEPRLDWARLEEIAGRVALPLALHGASGLPDDDLRRAVGLGVAKVNVNTELRAAYFDHLQRSLADDARGLDLKRLLDGARASVRAVVEAKLDLLGWEA